MHYLTAKKLDIEGDLTSYDVVIHEDFAEELGVREGDLLDLYYPGVELGVIIRLTDTVVGIREIGLFTDMWMKYKLPGNALVGVAVNGQAKSVEAIKKKILGEPLNYDQTYNIMKDISHYRLTPVEMTYFAATSYSPGFNEQETYFLTKAMAETGLILSFKKDETSLVLDKHSIGGVPSKGVTPILVPLIATMGYTIPNTSSRAITSPAGTSDILETIIPVSLNDQQIKQVVADTKGCLVWGGALNLAPADDILIQIERPLHIESYEQFIISIIAKKVAMGITHLLIDMPIGEGAKVPSEDAPEVREKFQKLCAKFDIKVETYERQARGPDGRGIGSILEARDFLWVLERSPHRPMELENLALDMAAKLLVLAECADYQHIMIKLREKLESREVLEKFWEMGFAQGAKEKIKADDLYPADEKFEIKALQDGVIARIDNIAVIKLTRALGCPFIKKAGLYFHKVVGDRVRQGDIVATAYSTTSSRIRLAQQALTDVADSMIIYR